MQYAKNDDFGIEVLLGSFSQTWTQLVKNPNSQDFDVLPYLYAMNWRKTKTRKRQLEQIWIIEASHMVQCEPWWNPNDMRHAQSRCWPPGQNKPVHVYVIRGLSSLIDYILRMYQEKKNSINTEITVHLRRKDNEEILTSLGLSI